MKIDLKINSTNFSKWSISARLTAWYGLSAFALVTLSTGVLYLALLNQLDRAAKHYLIEKKEVIQGIIDNNADPIPRLIDEIESEPSHQSKNTFLARVLNNNNQVIAETKNMNLEIPLLAVEKIPPEMDKEQKFQSKSEKEYSIMTFKHHNQNHSFKVLLAVDRSSDKTLLANYRTLLIWILICTFFLACLLGFFITHRGLAPIRQIASAVTKIKTTTLNERIDSKTLPQELASLAEVFNEMLDRIEESFNRLSRFSADIAHELRTPVHNLRGEIEVGISKARSNQEYEEILGSCLEECSRLSSMVDSLLFIARAEDPSMNIEKVNLQLQPELQKIKEFYEPVAQTQNTSVILMCEQEIIFPLEKSLFQRVVTNLLSNALKHTQSGKIVISATLKASSLVLEVEDTGIGIAPNDLPKITDRFYRCDTARSASQDNLGLGLSIVKSIAQLHGGSVSIRSQMGQGTTVAVTFPT